MWAHEYVYAFQIALFLGDSSQSYKKHNRHFFHHVTLYSGPKEDMKTKFHPCLFFLILQSVSVACWLQVTKHPVKSGRPGKDRSVSHEVWVIRQLNNWSLSESLGFCEWLQFVCSSFKRYHLHGNIQGEKERPISVNLFLPSHAKFRMPTCKQREVQESHDWLRTTKFL